MSTSRLSGLGSDTMVQLARDLHRMGPAGRRALNRRFRAVGQPMLAAARRNASWSTRIPGALSVRGTSSASTLRIGLQLRASAKKAPHARPYEGISAGAGKGSFRHPVHGNLDVWVSQRFRPFALPAVLDHRDSARDALLNAYEDAAREAGFR